MYATEWLHDDDEWVEDSTGPTLEEIMNDRSDKGWELVSVANLFQTSQGFYSSMEKVVGLRLFWKQPQGTNKLGLTDDNPNDLSEKLLLKISKQLETISEKLKD